MAQTLLLGLGGTGSSIVNYVAADLKKRKIAINDGNICCAVFDTNENDRETIKNSGVGIPTIPTSKDWIIEDYFNNYSDKGVLSWMPDSPALRKESMKDGAGQMRFKSRLAFMDTIENKTIHQLETLIDKLFDNRDDAKIRAMIVSSLAGGTGSGMFIQIALWLRKYFSRRKCEVTIRGIFVLPDVFIQTVEDIRKDNTEIQSLYANAYGAIRELNAITKIKEKGMSTLRPVKIDDLFDSRTDQREGKPVYDYVFFIDDISEGGSVLDQIDHYEQVVARLVYMQLYAPMHNNLYSEEDNLFKQFQKSKEPVFGSCGTSKAVYPTNDILRYCALRASQDALSSGWRKIDEEIKEKQRREAEKERNGDILESKIDPRHEYITLFDDKASKTGSQIGRDRLFVRIANDVQNESRITGEDGNTMITYSDRIDDFIAEFGKIITTIVDTKNPGNLSGLKLINNWVDKRGDTKESLIKVVKRQNDNVESFIEDMDSSVNSLAETVLDLVCPSDMGDINPDNKSSVFGLLSKKDNNNETHFVHPIAVRYLLYKLAERLELIKGSIDIDSARKCAIKGHDDGKNKISFDNPRTGKVVEDDPIEYLNSKKRLQNEEKFIKEFKSLYVQHNEGQAELCRAYAISLLKLRSAAILSQRLNKLIEIIEEFFRKLVETSNSLSEAISDNIQLNSQVKQKIIYVCASEKDKEALYQSLNFNVDSSEANINKIIAEALYGQLCAMENPEADNNKKYKNQRIDETFKKEIVSTYSKLIFKKNASDIDLDIYTAICKSADIKYEKEGASEKDGYDPERFDIDLNGDLEADEDLENDLRRQRHYNAVLDMKKRLLDLGAPFLISDNEQPEDSNENLIEDVLDGLYDDTDDQDVIFTPIKKHKTFWGFNPIVADKCPELAAILGIDINKQQSRAYSKNELDCYRAVYGIQAYYVPKFNELKNGDYYKNYNQVVRGMIKGVIASKKDDDLIHTPHMDKTWHLFLPYITPEKQDLEDNKFFRLFWLSLAYGTLYVDNNGDYVIRKLRKKGQQVGYEVGESVKYNGQNIGKSRVLELLAALRLDGSFMFDESHLERKFKEECENIRSYENTEFLRGSKCADVTAGGLASDKDNNAVTVIVRYCNSSEHDDDVIAMLIHSLENLCCDLVSKNYAKNETDKIKNAGYMLCKRIYDASKMKSKNIGWWFKHWNNV